MTIRWQPVPLALALAVGCNTPGPSAPTTAPSASIEPPTGRSIVGTVVLSTTQKPPPTGGHSPISGIVYLEDGPKDPGALMARTINIDHKLFTPFIQVITTGGTVTFGNKDDLAHHMFSPDLPKWDTGLLQKNQTSQRSFDTPGPIALLCNIHPEMLGYLLVIPSTTFGEIEPDGTYVIERVPPGTYKVTAWAPRTPVATQSVTVDVGPAKADFQLPAPTN